MSLPKINQGIRCHTEGCPGSMNVREKGHPDDVYHMYVLRCSTCKREEELEVDE